MDDLHSIVRVVLCPGGLVTIPDSWLPAPPMLHFICGHYPSGDAFAAVYPPEMMTKAFVDALANEGLKPEPVAVQEGLQFKLSKAVLAILVEQGAFVDIPLDIALLGQGKFFFIEGWGHLRQWLELSGIHLDEP